MLTAWIFSHPDQVCHCHKAGAFRSHFSEVDLLCLTEERMNRIFYKILKNPIAFCLIYFSHDSLFLKIYWSESKVNPVSKMLAIVLKSLNVFLSRMYNGVSIINQVAPLPLCWRAQSGSVHSKGLSSRSISSTKPCCPTFPHILSSCFNDFSIFCLILLLVIDSGMWVFCFNIILRSQWKTQHLYISAPTSPVQLA